MRAFLTTAALALITAAGALAQPGGVGTSPASPKHIASRFFKIPFGALKNAQEIRQLKLYLSANGGASWDLHGTAGPYQREFEVKVERDGPYAFALQIVYTNGDLQPTDTAGLRGSQFVVVDTEKPAIMLKPLPTRPSTEPGKIDVGVQWDVRDENLDPSSVRLEVRWAGQGQFVPIRDRAIGPQGEDVRAIYSMAKMEVRLTARDFAKNLAEQTVILGNGVGTGAVSAEPTARDTGLGSSGRPGTRYLRSNVVVLEFAIEEKGPSGIASGDLWTTRDGRDWKKADGTKPVINEKDDKITATFTAPEDGLFGFALIATSKANLSQPPPASSKDVQIWIKVDTKAPEANLVDVKFAQANDPQYIAISWKASDENLGATPITLQYSLEEKAADDKWLTLTDDPLTNSGRQVVKTPGVPGYQLWVRLKVVDLAGNQTVTSPKPVVLDLVRPRVKITDAMPGK
jgi:hypothetical protein